MWPASDIFMSVMAIGVFLAAVLDLSRMDRHDRCSNVRPYTKLLPVSGFGFVLFLIILLAAWGLCIWDFEIFGRGRPVDGILAGIFGAMIAGLIIAYVSTMIFVGISHTISWINLCIIVMRFFPDLLPPRMDPVELFGWSALVRCLFEEDLPSLAWVACIGTSCISGFFVFMKWRPEDIPDLEI